MHRKTSSLLRFVVWLGMTTTLGGCYVVNSAAMEFLYSEEALPASRVIEDVAYWDHPEADLQNTASTCSFLSARGGR